MKTADQLYDKSDRLLTEVDKSEKIFWRNSDIAKALLLKLEGDRLAICESWMDGGYTAESSDTTAQMNAKAIGTVQSIIAVQDWLTSLTEE